MEIIFDFMSETDDVICQFSIFFMQIRIHSSLSDETTDYE